MKTKNSYIADSSQPFLFVFCRGAATKKLKTHETIHFQQQLEMLFVFQWLMYLVFWIIGCIKYRNGKKAYYRNPFEQEAYDNEHNIDYLKNRKQKSRPSPPPGCGSGSGLLTFEQARENSDFPNAGGGERQTHPW